MAALRRLPALLLLPALMLGLVCLASAASRRLTVWRGSAHVVERSGKCQLGAWSLLTEEPWSGRLQIRAGVLAPQSCEPVEIKVEVTLWRKGRPTWLEAIQGNPRLNRWKVLPLHGSQALKRASIQAELDLEGLDWPLQRGDWLNVEVSARCRHGVTVVSEALYQF